MSPRNWPAPGWWRIWPSRPTRPRCVVVSGTPRPTGPTAGTCARRWSTGGCPNAGSRRAISRSTGRCSRPTAICVSSTPAGCSASTRCSSTRAPRSWARVGCVVSRAWPNCARSRPRSCPRSGSCRSPPPWTCSPRWTKHLDALHRRLLPAARHLAGAKVLAARLYGVGPVTALALTCWLAGAGRFSSTRKAVRFAGLDVTVYSAAIRAGSTLQACPPTRRRTVIQQETTSCENDPMKVSHLRCH